MVTAQVSFKNIKGFLGGFGDRLQDKPIKGSIKVGNNKESLNYMATVLNSQSFALPLYKALSVF